ncbi:MAG: oxygenase MpaB family protein [Verrucomicrobiota bacterium]
MRSEAFTQNPSLFPSDSAIWRITREHVLLLGGPAAAILQIAHPQVALGVAAHSDFRRNSLGRLRRTLDAVYTITFAPRAEVETMAERVRASHARVQGETPQPYSAFSPDAQMWVVATLVQLSIEMFGRFVAPLKATECEAFYHDMRIFGVFFGLPFSHGPQSWAEFTKYYAGMLAGDLLGNLPVSAELARHIAYPRKPAHLRVLWPLSGSAAREFLPSPLREKLGLPRTTASRLAAATMDALLPGLIPLLPPGLRFARKYRLASG